MLSRIDQKKIKLKLKNIYKQHVSSIEINNCCSLATVDTAFGEGGNNCNSD